MSTIKHWRNLFPAHLSLLVQKIILKETRGMSTLVNTRLNFVSHSEILADCL